AMGGEKPMDLAYLNAIIKSTYFPPYDPWFAGGYINYYYYGWVIVATVIKLTGIVPWVAYNLVLPTFFALVAMGAASVVYNLIPPGDDEAGWFPRAWRFGLVGACLVAVAGNLGELQLLLQGLQQLGDSVAFKSSIPGLVPLVKAVAGLWAVLTKGQSLPFRSEWWYWNASRIMRHGEINEFPFFTFLYADLHAHLTAMPFALLALGLATSFVVPRVGTSARHVHQESDAATGGSLSHRLATWWRQLDWGLGLQLTLVALTLGELWCNNSWDYPTYMGITLVAVAIGMYSATQRITQSMVARFVLYAGYVVLMSLLLFRPFHANFGLAYSSVEPWKGERTSLGAYLLIHGPALFILVSYSLALLFDRRLRHTLARAWRVTLGAGERRARAWHLYGLLVRCQSLGYEAMWLSVGGLLVVVLAALWAKAWVLLLALPLLALAVSLALTRRATAQQRFTTVLIAAGLALTLAVEYVVIKGDIGRMNTVFKFYLQVWIMWGIAGAVGLAYLVRRSQRLGSLWPFWRNLLTVLLISTALYPLFATQGKIRDRWDPNLPPSLDGMAYMTTVRYRDNDRDLVLEHDRQAILWMQDHIEGSPVIAEANTPLYRWGNRVSIYTGLPTIIGWDWHQKQQRAAVNGIVVDWRLQDLRDLYNTHDQQVALDILQRYRVGYIYVGELEQAYYDPQGLAKFGEMVGRYLEVAYQQPPVTIYRVLSSGASHTTRARPEQPLSATIVEWLQRHWIGGSVKAQAPEKRPSGDLIAAFEEPDLMLDRPVEDLPVLKDRAWNQPANATAWNAVLCWWLVLQCIGLAVWPMVARAFGCFADRGYALSKGMGLLVVSYLVWIGSSMRLFANSPPAAWLALLALGACSFFLWRRQRPALGSDVAFNRRLVLVEEALFTLAFGAFIGLRILNPDLWQPWFGGEKMMEIAFLNAVTKSAYMPPYDPYFSGGYINYYYYGYFIVSTLVKLTGIRPEVAFNLAVPTFFALTVVHAFGLAYHLSGGRRAVGSPPSRAHAQAVQAGLASGLFVAIMGNLSAPIQWLEWLARAGGATFNDYQATWADVNHLIQGLAMVLRGTAELPPFDYWYRATRVIPFTINEFPFFSFLFADLHPHMMAIPFTLLAVALALALIRDTRFGGLRGPLRWLFLCIAVGALGVINTWDLPLFWGVLCMAMLYRGYRLARGRGLLVATLAFFLFVLAALMLYAPFYAHYRAQYVGIEWVPSAERSEIAPFLVIWGLFIFLILSIEGLWLTEAQAWRRLRAIAARVGWRSTCRRLWAVSRMGIIRMLLGSVLLAGGATAGVYWVSQGMFVLALLALMLGLAACAWFQSGRDELAFLRRFLILAAVGTLLGIEIVYMRDFLSGGEWRRMNTIFKFYTQVWVILGLACGSLFPWLWRRVSVSWYRGLWRGAFGILLAGSLLYTALAIPVRVNERLASAWPPRGTLDGTAYMHVGIYYWPDPNQGIELWYEREAIEWLWENVSGTPVLVEAPIGFYREGGLKVTSYTGLPTLVGFHEREQRPWDQVDVRERDAEAIYTTTDGDHLLEILDRYQVRYIYVGQLERALYAEAGLAKFAELEQSGRMERVFQNEKVEIFHVV
ncbi:MAG: hypothetical protein JXA74_01685, partial [Anaerolineae bacterium]|nr:hypothetical protein [Anaerolineae bacterium]